MAQALLLYDLDNPDDYQQHARALKAQVLYLALWDYYEWLRGEVKYADHQALMPAYDRLTEILHGYDINLEGLLS